MNKKIKIGIVGYGNLGRGVELSVKNSDDMELVAIFTRRPDQVKPVDQSVKVVSLQAAEDFVDTIDVMILCSGSAGDLPEQGPVFASMFNTVDGYDNHQSIPKYKKAMDQASKASGKVSSVCMGWDPGLFSLNRVMMDAVMDKGSVHSFWGPGISQGHTNAVKKIPGVKEAVQYTVPIEEVMDQIRGGASLELTNGQKHKRECYIVAEDHADKEKITHTIKNMPAYFVGYETTVTFVDEEEFNQNHRGIHHGGFVIGSFGTGDGTHRHVAEFSLRLDSNAEFTASVLTAYARAAFRLNQKGESGAFTIYDIPMKYISEKPEEELYKNYL